ncbi:MAG: holin-like protein [Gammaproteobacteria bacterium]|jgi:holin-like protein
MKFFNGITLLLVFQLVGEIGVLALRMPVPGPVLGMLLLFVTLLLRQRTSKSLATASTALLSHLSLLFVPAGVGMMIHFDRIFAERLPLSLTLVLSTLITMAATAVIMHCSARVLSKRAKRA